MEMEERQFAEHVKEALDRLPAQFARAVENVAVVVEDEPSDEDILAAGLDPELDTLFGLYQGISLPDRGLEYSGIPDRIVIYRRPILEVCVTREEVVEEIRLTVLHELGHFFGLGEEDVP